MAESPQSVKNKGLLITAACLAVIIAVLYNVQMYQVRKSFETKKLEYIQVTRDLDIGNEITRADLEIVEIDETVKAAIGNAVDAKNMDYVLNKPLVSRVRKGEFLRWPNIQSFDSGDNASYLQSDDYTTFALAIDPELSLGDVVQRGDRVDIYATVNVPASAAPDGKPIFATKLVLEAVRVVTVGGTSGARDGDASTRPGRSQGLRSWRTLSVEVKRIEMAHLINLKDYVRGSWVVSLRRRDMSTPPEQGTIHDESLRRLKPFAGPPRLGEVDSRGFQP